jgi:hypothetical protein
MSTIRYFVNATDPSGDLLSSAAVTFKTFSAASGMDYIGSAPSIFELASGVYYYDVTWDTGIFNQPFVALVDKTAGASPRYELQHIKPDDTYLDQKISITQTSVTAATSSQIASGLSEIKGVGFSSAVDSLVKISATVGNASGGMGVVASSVSGTLVQFVKFMGTELLKARKSETNKWAIIAATNQLVFYEDDKVTPFITFDLKDIAGNPTITNVASRTPA